MSDPDVELDGDIKKLWDKICRGSVSDDWMVLNYVTEGWIGLLLNGGGGIHSLSNELFDPSNNVNDVTFLLVHNFCVAGHSNIKPCNIIILFAPPAAQKNKSKVLLARWHINTLLDQINRYDFFYYEASTKEHFTIKRIYKKIKTLEGESKGEEEEEEGEKKKWEYLETKLCGSQFPSFGGPFQEAKYGDTETIIKSEFQLTETQKKKIYRRPPEPLSELRKNERIWSRLEKIFFDQTELFTTDENVFIFLSSILAKEEEEKEMNHPDDDTFSKEHRTEVYNSEEEEDMDVLDVLNEENSTMMVTESLPPTINSKKEFKKISIKIDSNSEILTSSSSSSSSSKPKKKKALPSLPPMPVKKKSLPNLPKIQKKKKKKKKKSNDEGFQKSLPERKPPGKKLPMPPGKN